MSSERGVHMADDVVKADGVLEDDGTAARSAPSVNCTDLPVRGAADEPNVATAGFTSPRRAEVDRDGDGRTDSAATVTAAAESSAVKKDARARNGASERKYSVRRRLRIARADSAAAAAPAADGDDGVERSPFTKKPYTAKYYELQKARQRLPVYSKRDELLDMVAQHRFLVLVGDTGSGKTTQVPQLLAIRRKLQPDGSAGTIACTQPRRIAAVTVAERVADEMDVPLGDEVGYAIRYDDVTSSRTVLKYCTDGLLLRESIGDPTFQRYAVVILDEVHERTISTDILMGILKNVARAREDFRLVIMSATLDAAKLQHYFDDAPLLHIPGRMFPVDIRYSSEGIEDYLEASIQEVVSIHAREGDGDVLLFLTGEEEIQTACKRIGEQIENQSSKGYRNGVSVVPLYSALPSSAMQRAFAAAPVGRRKIVVSTNVAETSVTIDGIVFVVDPGFAKQKVYNPRNRIESLQVAPVSAASAVQRTGRAGRTRPGKCVRLYTERTFQQLTAMTYPEILRSNLNSVVLQLRALNINPVQFDFIDPPPPETVMRALEALLYLGALNAGGGVTDIGALMSAMPFDPELARMTLAATKLGVPQEVLAIVAMLSAAPNCFVRPATKTRAADDARRRFESEISDHITLLNVFTAYLQQRARAGDWCWHNFLNERALESAVKAKEQVERMLLKEGFDMKSRRFRHVYEEEQAIRRALVCGGFMLSAVQFRKGWYMTTKDSVEVKAHPSCGVRSQPMWVIYNELVITSKAFIRTVTEVDVQWLLGASAEYFSVEHFQNPVVRAELTKVTGVRARPRQRDDTAYPRRAY